MSSTSPVIKFEGYEITEISLKPNDVEKSNELNFEIKKMIRNDYKHAILFLGVEIHYKENKFLRVEIQGQFSTEMDLTEDDFDNFISINGVSILFPYIRSTVSVITSLDSGDSVLLPTINVTQLYDEVKQEPMD